MHRWHQPTGPLCSQMNLSKALNWHGFMLGCGVDRTRATACWRGHQGAVASTETLLYCPIAVRVCAGLTGCLSSTTPHHDLTYRRGFRLKPPSAIFSRLKAGRAQKSQVPGHIKQVSARVSRLNPKNPPYDSHATLRQKNHLTS